MEEQQRILAIFTSFREVNQAFYHSMSKSAYNQGITPIQFLVMKALAEQPQMGLSELSECLHTGKSTMSGVVDRLVRAGFVLRERPENDRRAIALRLTPKGEELWKRTNTMRVNRLAPILELSDEDQAHLLRIHGQIVDILQRVREESNDE
ncbi:MarR family winged helix-turn-helix transcriptional regulator [Cohnella nanjingensis]|uniref:MarR family transcriptional regulator n=1 Tax=Cohnella nanjingensis TaxID=1387779 RepID=A0A7X0S043_9BACL|nr:MarR family transcriptional regulator [Cohnella nanjingensis]MBB6675480.1 MarR family transcriptional regulator [Cohnella nanjingensis]